MFKAFSQIVCRIKLTSVTDVGKKNLQTFPVTPTFQRNNKKAEWKRSKTSHLHFFQSI